MAAFASGQPRSDWRIALALSVSLAVHGSLLALIGPQSGGSARAVSAPLQARLEATRSDSTEQHPDASVAQLTQDKRDEAPAEPAPRVESAPSVPAPSQQTEAVSAGAASGNDRLPEAPIPLPPDLTYYPVSMLDSPPRLLGSADECYPPGASGEVAYLLLIDEAGRVDQASILEYSVSGGHAADVIDSCRAMKFVPAIKDGRAVRSRVRFVIGQNPPP